MWKDGCLGQFKSMRTWYFVSRYPYPTTSTSDISGCSLIYNFFTIGHGKGEVDGIRVLLKKEIPK